MGLRFVCSVVASFNVCALASLARQANTMLLYPLAEAITLLAAKLATARASLAATIEDLEFLREQVTVMEVNFARVHNWDVKRRRALKEANAEGQEGQAGGGKARRGGGGAKDADAGEGEDKD